MALRSNTVKNAFKHAFVNERGLKMHHIQATTHLNALFTSVAVCPRVKQKLHHRPEIALAAAADGHLGAASTNKSPSYNHLVPPGLLKQLVTCLKSQYLPIVLISALVFGACNPGPGLAAAKMNIPSLATFGIFLVQASNWAVSYCI